MKYKKGISGNTNGRPKDSRNKVAGDLRSRISVFLDSEFGAMRRSFRNLDDAKNVRSYIDLVSFVIPKLASEKMEINFEHLTDQQLDYIIECLKKSAT